jgi:hypothetical protein
MINTGHSQKLSEYSSASRQKFRTSWREWPLWKEVHGSKRYNPLLEYPFYIVR